MPQFCFTIAGKRHCFDIPLLVDNHIRRPPPGNYPELELAFTVIELAKVAPASDLSKQLTETSLQFVKQVSQQLPKGTEIVTTEVRE